MKKFFLIMAAIIAAIVLISNVGSLIFFVISIALAYYGIRKFIMAETTGMKFWWVIFILIGFSMSLSNIPALIALVALVALYYIYKNWNEEEKVQYKDSSLNWDEI